MHELRVDVRMQLSDSTSEIIWGRLRPGDNLLAFLFAREMRPVVGRLGEAFHPGLKLTPTMLYSCSGLKLAHTASDFLRA